MKIIPLSRKYRKGIIVLRQKMFQIKFSNMLIMVYWYILLLGRSRCFYEKGIVFHFEYVNALHMGDICSHKALGWLC